MFESKYGVDSFENVVVREIKFSNEVLRIKLGDIAIFDEQTLTINLVDFYSLIGYDGSDASAGGIKMIANKWIEINKLSKLSASDVEEILENWIYSDALNIKFRVSLEQFGLLVGAENVDIKIERANRIKNIILENVDETGVYIEKRSNVASSFNLELRTEPEVVFKDRLILSNFNNEVFEVEGVNADGSINSNNIKIVPKSAGVAYLTIQTENSMYQIGNTIDASTKVVLRVKVADGKSEETAFEISKISDLKQMYADLKSKNNYYYVLTNDLTLSNNNALSWKDISGVFATNNGEDLDTFSLNGKLDYVYNGVSYSKFSTLNVVWNITQKDIADAIKNDQISNLIYI